MRLLAAFFMHVSIFLAGNVKSSTGQGQWYPTGLRDDEDFWWQSSGSGNEQPGIDNIYQPQSSGSEPLGPAYYDTTEPYEKTQGPIWWPPFRTTTSSSTTSTATTTTTTTTTTSTTTTATTAPFYSLYSGVPETTTSSITSQLDESCLPVSHIPTYPWPVKVYCNTKTNTLRAICIIDQYPQRCHCVEPIGGRVLYNVEYPNCRSVTTTYQPVWTYPTVATPREQAKLRTLPPTTTEATRPVTSRTTLKKTTTFEVSKIDQETLNARAETTKSWDQGVPVIATFMGQPGLLAAIICGAVVGLLTAVLLIMFLVYRMRKKDEGSYVIEEPSKRVPLVQPFERTREYYA